MRKRSPSSSPLSDGPVSVAISIYFLAPVDEREARVKALPICVAVFLAAFSVAAPASAKLGVHLQHPVRGPIHSGYGYRTHPLLKTTLAHLGVDYRGRLGECIRAAAPGTVVVAGREGGYGRYVRIDHGHGLQTAYAHLGRIGVRRGERVRSGQVIGTVGMTGVSSRPPHLHFEVHRRNRAVNPVSFLPPR
jgi:murein DD-endopeptidase MepM/ murein hydrolase activator NlpD